MIEYKQKFKTLGYHTRFKKKGKLNILIVYCQNLKIFKLGFLNPIFARKFTLARSIDYLL
jgi:hypothetical protein